MSAKSSSSGTGVPGFIGRRRGVSLSVTLAVSISILVLIAVLAVLGLGLWSGTQNTMSLLRDKASFMVSTTIDQIRNHLDPARDQVAFVERLIANGALDPGDRQRFVATMTGALAAAPQINALLFIDPEFQALGVARTPTGAEVFTQDYSGDPRVRDGMRAGLTAKGTVWGEPLWREEADQTVLNVRLPVRRGDRFLGLLVAAVGVRQLSSYLGGLDPAVGSNVFILYDRTRALAHPNLQSGVPGLSDDKPLPSLAETGDPVLAAIWRRDGRYPLEIIKGTDLEGHVLQLFNEQYIYIYRNISGYGGQPWQVGSYFRATDINTEMRRLMWAAIAGLGTLVLAVFAAVLLGRRIARPVVELAAAASRIGKLEISETAELPGSIFRELNDQARAFNAMLRGLRWFEIYVPKKLVRRLIGQGNAGLPASVEREVTVMFTDITSFTSQSEAMTAPETAEFLNEHFAMLSRCVEAEGGTIDKFIGDALMAFWGAPESLPDHGARACRAALAIREAVAADNARRRAQGSPPVRVRIGLHTGEVIVGNIGAPGRINYTIVGDAVNTANRLEQLGKEIGEKDADVTIVLSDATASAAGNIVAPTPAGTQRVRGREEQVEVYRL